MSSFKNFKKIAHLHEFRRSVKLLPCHSRESGNLYINNYLYGFRIKACPVLTGCGMTNCETRDV